MIRKVVKAYSKCNFNSSSSLRSSTICCERTLKGNIKTTNKIIKQIFGKISITLRTGYPSDSEEKHFKISAAFSSWSSLQRNIETIMFKWRKRKAHLIKH